MTIKCATAIHPKARANCLATNCLNVNKNKVLINTHSFWIPCTDVLLFHILWRSIRGLHVANLYNCRRLDLIGPKNVANFYLTSVDWYSIGTHRELTWLSMICDIVSCTVVSCSIFLVCRWCGAVLCHIFIIRRWFIRFCLIWHVR